MAATFELRSIRTAPRGIRTAAFESPDASPRRGRQSRAGGDCGDLAALVGPAGWARLPEAVRQRFREQLRPVVYRGTFEIVRASRLGRLLAHAARFLGTPVATRTGTQVCALVRVCREPAGVTWTREYRWPRGSACVVRSTKIIDPLEGLIERLPGRLAMPLDVFEHEGALHFVSRGYYFDLGRRRGGRRRKLWLPRWLSPGVTHVEHRDEGHGWFRFTMTVTHPRLGELFYQTGRFAGARR
jgi:Domain of unknown function (DUF4166)